MNTIKKLLDLLTEQEYKRALLLLGMILIMAIIDVIGVASIMPFMAVLANPGLINTNILLNTAYRWFDFNDAQQFMYSLGIIVFVMLLFSLIFKALTTYVQLRFTLMREYSISKHLVEGYLHQPYSWFLNRNSSDLGKIILSEVNTVIYNGIMPTMTLIAQGAVSLLLITLLIFVDSKLAFIVGLTLSVSYVLVFSATRDTLRCIGEESVKANFGRFKAVSEAFGATKEVKVAGLEKAYVERFAAPAHTFAKHQATAQILSQLPRFALEAIAFGGMLLVVLYLIGQRGSFADALPNIALYAYAGYRLMPALQQIYGAVSQLRFAGPAINTLHADLMSLVMMQKKGNSHTIRINQSITLNNINYTYPGALKPTLKNLNLKIPAKSLVALVGSTGSGKTTTIDLILGLLEPCSGELKVDEQVITIENRTSWQRAIGYVPQQIFLSDDTIAANIAFGVKPEDIDERSLIRASKIANLHDFVINDLPQQYKTIVGERGVRLSGGQRQRIGIARAMYNNPQLLIFDEATSALDNLTEQAVMNAVYSLSENITVILIAHRLTTVQRCDIIFLMDKGEIEGNGSFEELNRSNSKFRAMTAASIIE